MLGRKEREREWRRQELLKAAEELFAKKGFYKTAMADIARISEFPLATIYKFFKSKDEIYLTLVREKIEKMIAIEKNSVVGHKTAKEKIKSITKQHLNFFQENRDFFKIYIKERIVPGISLKDEVGLYIYNKHKEYTQFVAGILKSGIKRKEFRPLDPLKISILIVGAMDALIYQLITEDEIENPSENLELLIDVIFKGIEKQNF